MSHWFHRCILKSTRVVNFQNVFPGGLNHSKLSSDLKKARDRLLELLPDAAHDLDTFKTAYILYLSLMNGFLSEFTLSGKKDWRYAVEYKWTHSLLGQGAETSKDAVFDIANMSVNVAIWHMKHASYLCSKPRVDMDDAKEVNQSLRKAAGIFQMVKRDLLPLLEKNSKPGSDLDPRVLSAFQNQCTGEAQEVTVARAIELKHNKGLISSLAADTSQMFEEAARHLKDVDKTIAEQWVYYLNIKENIYQAYAYSYLGHNLLDENECGVAIRSLRESEKHYEAAVKLCKPYSKAKGPARPVKPYEHTFFTKVNTMVHLTLEKCERENGFIYHQKVPDDPPELQTKAAFGLASPEEYNLPPTAPLWQIAAEDDKSLGIKPSDSGPQSSKGKPKQSDKEADHKEENLPVVKEAKPASTTEKPDSDHGCVIQ